MDWIRARKPEQVEQRRQAILEAAGQLFAAVGYDAVTLEAIAREAGTAKSNLYRYFTSKEAIFTHIYLQEMRLWAQQFAQATAAVPQGDVERFAEVASQSVSAHPRLAELMTLLAGVLERNLRVEEAVPFKLSIAGLLEQPVAAVLRVFPSLGAEAVQGFFTIMHALVAGLYPMQAVAERLAPHLAQHGLCRMVVRFQPALQGAVCIYLKGLLNEEQAHA